MINLKTVTMIAVEVKNWPVTVSKTRVGMFDLAAPELGLQQSVTTIEGDGSNTVTFFFSPDHEIGTLYTAQLDLCERTVRDAISKRMDHNDQA